MSQGQSPPDKVFISGEPVVSEAPVELSEGTPKVRGVTEQAALLDELAWPKKP